MQKENYKSAGMGSVFAIVAGAMVMTGSTGNLAMAGEHDDIEAGLKLMSDQDGAQALNADGDGDVDGDDFKVYFDKDGVLRTKTPTPSMKLKALAKSKAKSSIADKFLVTWAKTICANDPAGAAKRLMAATDGKVGAAALAAANSYIPIKGAKLNAKSIKSMCEAYAGLKFSGTDAAKWAGVHLFSLAWFVTKAAGTSEVSKKLK